MEIEFGTKNSIGNYALQATRCAEASKVTATTNRWLAASKCCVVRLLSGANRFSVAVAHCCVKDVGTHLASYRPVSILPLQLPHPRWTTAGGSLANYVHTAESCPRFPATLQRQANNFWRAGGAVFCQVVCRHQLLTEDDARARCEERREALHAVYLELRMPCPTPTSWRPHPPSTTPSLRA